MQANYNDLSVFIIDDDPVCRELYNQYLVNMGISKVQQFDNGQDCINHLTKKPDIILLDHQMTPINGLETLKKIKRVDPDIFLIYVSAQKDMKVAIDALKYGAFDYIIKGQMEDELLGAIVEKITTLMTLVPQKTPGRLSRLASMLTFSVLS